MRALVVYESLWGNTEQIARAVAAELATKMDVEVVDADTAPVSLEGIDLFPVGVLDVQAHYSRERCL